MFSSLLDLGLSRIDRTYLDNVSDCGLQSRTVICSLIAAASPEEALSPLSGWPS